MEKRVVGREGIWGVESDDSGMSWGHPNALWNLVIMLKRYGQTGARSL